MRVQQKVVCSKAEIFAVCEFWSRIAVNFHDVTMVNIKNVPESSICIPELSTLSQQWPPVVISHMGWRQQELEGMCAVAKQSFHQSAK